MSDYRPASLPYAVAMLAELVVDPPYRVAILLYAVPMSDRAVATLAYVAAMLAYKAVISPLTFAAFSDSVFVWLASAVTCP